MNIELRLVAKSTTGLLSRKTRRDGNATKEGLEILSVPTLIASTSGLASNLLFQFMHTPCSARTSAANGPELYLHECPL